MSTVVLSVGGKIQEIGNSLVEKVFEKNPYMNKIYPTTLSREMPFFGGYEIVTIRFG